MNSRSVTAIGRAAIALFIFSTGAVFSQEKAESETPSGDPPPFAGKTIEQLTADEVLKLVRYSYTLYDRDFTGQLRLGVVKKVPFLLSLKPESIRFIFSEPDQVIYLDTRNKDFSLFEGIDGKDLQPVSEEKYGEQIRGTDVTYDDLSMRFLYWPNARIVKQEKFKGRDVWLVRARNPDGQRGIYSTVDCWIDKESGGLMKMLGYNRQGRPIRQVRGSARKEVRRRLDGG